MFFLRETYRRHDHLTLEPPSNPVVDTFRFSPVRGHAHEGVGLVAVPFLRMFLHDRDVLLGRDHLCIRMVSKQTDVKNERIDRNGKRMESAP